MNFSPTKPRSIDLKQYITQNLNNALDINGENSYTNSFFIELAENDKGFFFIPNLPVSYPVSNDLYFKIADICSGILYPYKTLLNQNNAYFLPYKEEEANMARALFFPWVDGIPTRLIINDLDKFIQLYVREDTIPIMANNVSINMNEVLHLAISGSSESGKSKFAKYLLRCISFYNDNILLIDPKMADIYSLGKSLGLKVLAL